MVTVTNKATLFLPRGDVWDDYGIIPGVGIAARTCAVGTNKRLVGQPVHFYDKI